MLLSSEVRAIHYEHPALLLYQMCAHVLFWESTALPYSIVILFIHTHGG